LGSGNVIGRIGCHFVLYASLPIPKELIQVFRTQSARRKLDFPAVMTVVWLNTFLGLSAELPDEKL
jgi:hypothetical protein